QAAEGPEETTISLDDFALEDSGGEEPDIEMEAIALDEEEKEKAEKEDEIELNLEDLKVNETGELEIGGISEPAEAGGDEEEKTLAMDDISPEESSSGEDFKLDLDEMGLDLDLGSGGKKSDADEEGESIDLESLELELDLDDSDKK
ncbi:MAG: hypothetical protein JXL84_07930, partial [Deltaproteobacteria bacterium]|nr:hypothetical protein [Deltaproteobacteria bacterium]